MSTNREREIQKAQGRRLKLARVNRGYDSAKAAAKALKISKDTYTQHENGTRGYVRGAARYAELFEVPIEWLLIGDNPPDWALGEPEPAGPGQANYLQQWRIYRHLEVGDLAHRADVSSQLIEMIEAERTPLSDKVAHRLAGALETTAGSLLDVDPHLVDAATLEFWRAVSERQRQTLRPPPRLSATA